MAAMSGEAKMGAMWQTTREIAWPVIRDCAILRMRVRWLGEQTSSIGVFVSIFVINPCNSFVL
jgi:hypothetical protein